MKTPPFLLGAGLLFWGWQSGHVPEGALMAVALEGARIVKARWEFTDDDFRRIWTFCALLLLAAALYAFADTGGPRELGNFLQNPNLGTERNVGNASARTISALIRWLPMIFFLFIAAQLYSTREGIPAETISVILSLRWQKARRLGQPPPPSHSLNISYPYFILCLFSSSFHVAENQTFFWGLCVLIVWALWPQRSRRFGLAAWIATLLAVMLLGYSSQRGIWRLYRVLENYNAQWLARGATGGADPLQSKTALGRIGWMKGSRKIIIRLEPRDGSRAPGLLREASYRTWKGQAWYADVLHDKFESVFEQPDHTTWVLLPGKTNSATVNIACYLHGRVGLLPLPAGSGRLQNLSAYLVEKSILGAVLVQGPGLLIFDALFGPGDSLDSAPDPKLDLFVPEKEIPGLQKVIGELQLQPGNQRQIKGALAGFFQDKFKYSSWSGWGDFRSTNGTPLSQFLLSSRSGHCEYFATATVLLLRQLGVPARYAVGYAVHEASGKQFVVRQSDAHAWCLVWNAASGTWQDFDTTPASWIAAEGSRASPLQFLSDLWARLIFEIAKFRWGQTHLRQYLLWALVPILSLLLYQILFRSRRRRHGRQAKPATLGHRWPGLDSEFYQIEQRLQSRAAPRQPDEALSAWLQRTGNDPRVGPLLPRLQSLLALHYRYRFDPRGLSQRDREALRRETRECLETLA